MFTFHAITAAKELRSNDKPILSQLTSAMACDVFSKKRRKSARQQEQTLYGLTLICLEVLL